MSLIKGTKVGETFEAREEFRWVKLFADPTADEPSGLVLQSVNDSGTRTNYWLWFDDSGNLRSHTSEPSDQDADGSAISGTAGAATSLNNLASVAINTSLISDTDNTDDLGSNAKQWKDLYLNGVAYVDQLEADIGWIGDSAKTNCLKIADTGVVTLEGTATFDGIGTGNFVDKSAAEVITGGWDFTTAAVEIKADDLKLGFGTDGISDSYILFNGTDLIFYDTNYGSTITLSSLALNTITGDLTVSDGQFSWTDTTDEVAGTWTFAGTASNDITWSSSVTTADVLSITADALTSGSMLYLESSASGMAGKYIQCYDGAADDFSVGANGAVTIAGAAADVLTLTAGNLQMTDGNIDMDEGKIEVDSTADEQSYIARNNGTGTNAVVKIQEANTTPTAGVLHIDQDATGDADAVQIDNAGTGFAVTSTGGAAGSEGFEFISAASATGHGLLLDGATGGAAWIGNTDTGFLHIHSDGTLAQTTASLAYFQFSGTSASGGLGTCIHVNDTSTSGGGTEYAVYIKSDNSEALRIDSGRAVFDEGLDLDDSGTLTFGAGGDISITSDGTNVHQTNTGAFTIGDGGSSNYSSFAASTGLLTFAGTARPTDSIWLAPNDFNAVSGPALGLVPTSSAVGWQMDGGSSELIVSSFRTPENWASGTDLTVKIYYCANDANTQNVKLDTHCLFLTDGTDNASTGSYVVDTVTDTMAGAAYVLNVATITVAAADVVADEICSFKVERDAADAADTLDAIDIYILGVEIGYIADRV